MFAQEFRQQAWQLAGQALKPSAMGVVAKRHSKYMKLLGVLQVVRGALQTTPWGCGVAGDPRGVSIAVVPRRAVCQDPRVQLGHRQQQEGWGVLAPARCEKHAGVAR